MWAHVSFLPLDRRFLKIEPNLPLGFLFKILHQKSAHGYSGFWPGNSPFLGGGGEVPPGREHQLESLPHMLKPQGLCCYHRQKRHMWAPTSIGGGSVYPRDGLDFRELFWSLALRLARPFSGGECSLLISNLDPPLVIGPLSGRKRLCR